jgi:hypothetical protein
MTSAAAQAILPSVVDPDPAKVWFGQSGYVQSIGGERYCVMLGDVLVGTFRRSDAAARDVLIVLVVNHLGTSTGVSWGDVAKAFRVGRATVGRALQRNTEGGMPAVATSGRRGPRSKRTPQLRRRLYELFDQGLSIRAAQRVIAKRAGYGTVQAIHEEWRREREADTAASSQRDLRCAEVTSSVPEAPRTANDNAEAAAVATSNLDLSAPPLDMRIAAAALTDAGADAGAEPGIGAGDVQTAGADPLLPPEPSRHALQRRERAPEELFGDGESVLVQHAGTWVFLVMLQALGVYDEATRWSRNQSRVTLRVVLDLLAMTLALGERCVEGARRLETPSSALLLRHTTMVSPNWMRRVLGRFAAEAAVMFRAHVTALLLRRSARDRARVWLYVDNHTRRYTGKRTIRKAWRMQDKRAVPGTTDYYVHDDDGHPLYRVTASNHSSLSDWLPRVLKFARQVLGAEPEIVLSFDRGGSYPNTLAELKTLAGAFVTFERKPYELLAKCAFTERMEIVLPSRPHKPIVLHYTEASDKNLRQGRGRVRRIAVLTDDGNQINLLTSSTAPAEDLIRGHLARWGNQENQFKHGNERWGINQLDGREVVPYPPSAIIPNPDRSTIERKIALARAAEGKARCELAAVDAEGAVAERLREDIERAVRRQDELKTLRPTAPTHAPVEKTSLAGKLVRHTTEYKDVVDTLRIVFANVEADLASVLAPYLARPREAKKVLANLLAAPGTIRLSKGTLRVRLMPAGTPNEHRALSRLLHHVNQECLHLPGDPTRRRVHFSIARVSDR